MSWGNQVSTTTIVTTTTTQHTHEGSVENDFPNYQVAYGANSGKSPEYRADARIQQLANAVCYMAIHEGFLFLIEFGPYYSCEKISRSYRDHLRNMLRKPIGQHLTRRTI